MADTPQDPTTPKSEEGIQQATAFLKKADKSSLEKIIDFITKFNDADVGEKGLHNSDDITKFLKSPMGQALLMEIISFIQKTEQAFLQRALQQSEDLQTKGSQNRDKNKPTLEQPPPVITPSPSPIPLEHHQLIILYLKRRHYQIF